MLQTHTHTHTPTDVRARERDSILQAQLICNVSSFKKLFFFAFRKLDIFVTQQQASKQVRVRCTTQDALACSSRVLEHSAQNEKCKFCSLICRCRCCCCSKKSETSFHVDLMCGNCEIAKAQRRSLMLLNDMHFPTAKC